MRGGEIASEMTRKNVYEALSKAESATRRLQILSKTRSCLSENQMEEHILPANLLLHPDNWGVSNHFSAGPLVMVSLCEALC